MEKTSAYSTREAARFIGVSHERVAAWRRGERPALQPDNARSIRQFLEKAPGSAADKSRVETMALTIAAARLEQIAAELRAEAEGKGKQQPPPRETVNQVKQAAEAVQEVRQQTPRKQPGRKGA